MTSKAILETPDYILQTGISLEHEGRACYQLINKVYDVVEVETFLLPQAMEYLEQVQAGLDARRDMEKERLEAMKKAPDPVVAFPH